MKPFDYFIFCFKNYAKFSGRARRSEFWFFVLFNFVISSALNVVSQSLWYATDSYAFLSISYIYSLAVAIPALAVTVRRLHDTGRSGWWLLAYYLPIVLTVVLFVIFFVQLLSEFSFYKLDSIRAEDLPWTTVGGVLLSLLLSLIFGILILVWLCTDSQPGTNKYGPYPKEMITMALEILNSNLMDRILMVGSNLLMVRNRILMMHPNNHPTAVHPKMGKGTTTKRTRMAGIATTNDK